VVDSRRVFLLTRIDASQALERITLDPRQRLPVGFALTGAKADERQVLIDMLHADPSLTTGRYRS
jgi:uncharacterized protein YukJ